MEKYEIIKVIGEGNYGMAVLVKNIIDQNFYVIKSIDIKNFNKEQIENALYEVNVIKKLQHPYIVKYYESFYEDNFLCIVMEYADCGDLHKLIKSQKKINIFLQENIILNWFVQLCFAVKYIHEKKILHRDLKLSNVFLCSDGNIKLGDFGIAKILSDKEQYAKTIVGTPYYLSPEICLKKPYNQKSDIWSMGCILYEMMNLKHAFEASNIGELILKILKGEFDQLSNFYPQTLRELVKEMLNTESEKRPEITDILSMPYMLKYIKMNLIRQLTYKKSNVTKEREGGVKLEETKRESYESLNLNLDYISLPTSQNSEKINLTTSDEISVYKISSGHTSKNSSSRLTTENISNKGSKSIESNKILKEDKNSDFTKIEKLKKYLENFLGLDNFLEIYFKTNVIR